MQRQFSEREIIKWDKLNQSMFIGKVKTLQNQPMGEKLGTKWRETELTFSLVILKKDPTPISRTLHQNLNSSSLPHPTFSYHFQERKKQHSNTRQKQKWPRTDCFLIIANVSFKKAKQPKCTHRCNYAQIGLQEAPRKTLTQKPELVANCPQSKERLMYHQAGIDVPSD